MLLYGGVISAAQVRTVADAFRKATGIGFDLLPITGAAAMTRISEEVKVGLAPDLFEATGGWLRQLSDAGLLLPLRPLSLPVWRDPASCWNVHPGYKVDDWRYVLSRLRVRQGHLGINTVRLAGAALPTSWHDLATSPRFLRSMVLLDPSRSTSATAEFIIQSYVGKGMTPQDLWNLYGAQQAMLVSMARANVQAVAQGERAMTFPPLDETVLDLVEAGAPVRNIYLPGAPIFAETAEMGVITAGAHPNAATVFVNWYLSAEGQKLLGGLLSQTSIRHDVPNGVPLSLRGTVVGGGTKGPIVVDSPIQTKLIQDVLRSGIMRELVKGSAASFGVHWDGFRRDWEARHGGPQDRPMRVGLA